MNRTQRKGEMEAVKRSGRTFESQDSERNYG